MSTYVSANHSTPVGPKQWAEIVGISLSHFYKLRREGLGPDVLEIGTGSGRGRKLITPAATTAWLTMMANRQSSAHRPVQSLAISVTRRRSPDGGFHATEYYVNSETVTPDGRCTIGAIVSGPFSTFELAQSELDRLVAGGNHG